MSPYQHLFSTNAVLNVWRNLRSNHRPGEPNDLLLTLQYQPDEGRTRNFTKGNGVASGKEVEGDNGGAGGNGVGVGVGAGGRSIGFVVPWRSMQAQKRELREKEKELAEALVVLAGEVAFTGMYIYVKPICLIHSHLISCGQAQELRARESKSGKL